MKTKTIYMGTTQIAPQKTAAEIVEVLVDSGARQIGLDYAPDGSLRGLQFVIPVNGQDFAFKLPVRIEGSGSVWGRAHLDPEGGL